MSKYPFKLECVLGLKALWRRALLGLWLPSCGGMFAHILPFFIDDAMLLPHATAPTLTLKPSQYPTHMAALSTSPRHYPYNHIATNRHRLSCSTKCQKRLDGVTLLWGEPLIVKPWLTHIIITVKGNEESLIDKRFSMWAHTIRYNVCLFVCFC